MRTKFNGILTLLLAFVVHISFAQEKTISGTVTDQDGLPLPGVNIVVEGTTNGTQTDFDGNYSISAAEGQSLLFTYIGQKDIRQIVGAGNSMNVQMQEDAQALEEVVVTALGVKKEAQSLGYSIAKVDGDEVAQKPSSDVGRLLQGKAAGVNITASNGLSGSSTNIVIRGYTSITGSNQPLFVVDGVPFGSDTNNNEAFFDNATESSRFLDLDPNNIADINVLKGLSATALYGNRGRNGVILITTKNAQGGDFEGKTTVTVSSSTFFSNPHLPEYQQEYGGGFDQEFGWYFSNWGPRFGDTNPGIWTGYLNEIRDGRVFLNHPFATNTVPAYITGYEDLAAGQYEYKAYQSVPEFFRTGVYTSQSVGINGGNGTTGYNVTYSRTEDKSFVPGNRLMKNNFGVGGSTKLGKLSVNASLNYSVTDLNSPPIAASRGSGVEGDGASLFGDLMYTPRSVDLSNIPYTRADGGSLYYRETNSIQNPNWTVENSKTGQKVDRFFGNVSLSYELSENLSASYRYGLDIYNEGSFYGQQKGGIDGNALGLYRTQKIRNMITDHNMSINYDKDLNENFNLKLVGGFNANSILFERDGLESTNQIAYGVLKHWNFTNAASSNSFNGINFQRKTQNNTYGVYADVSLGYKDFLYLNGSVRNDWTSTLESDNNSLLYPSASVSFVPTNAFEGLRSDGNGLNYLKLRFGYGSSAGFPSVYSTRNTLSLSGRAFVDESGNVVSSNTTSNFLGNPTLEPETVSEIEIGVDTRFLNNRVGLNASIFKKETKDLITDKDLDPSTGYTLTTINGGDMEVKGVEVDLDLHLVKSVDNGFNWKTNVNFYADESLVTRLPDGIDQIIIGNFFTADAKNAAIVGQPFGVLIGDKIVRDDAGNKVITASTGAYVNDTNDVPIGDPNPDWTASLDNTFTYKGFSIGATLGYRHGGDIFSKTAVTLLSRGVIDFPFDRLGTYVLPGVNPDGNVNTTQIGATDIAFSNWLGQDELEVWDGTTIRLRDVRLGYSLSSKMLEKTPFASLSFTLSGSNLWYKAVNFPEGVNFDTNTLSNGVGNNIGLEYFSGPSSKRYGFSIKATF
ncbi:SusC/RagA family TonB-linked outer membrane protein [Maribacter sp. HTCC2170]|uniref:SusC/RagA family TonB-linked outer membrane protein n=1 Tax=Maribacter sp. (strain HTCC2170 / KCCM 42371) TaxID=313603 RepID=UPI00006BD5A1|nr:SusC/RagA family TonB-linked outer membrane protein [Maribacter sp. HTCC2170]EAR02126.1 putative outer membrane protein, probably involved in nutrient binding [Maribacter sp. HTCC2170]